MRGPLILSSVTKNRDIDPERDNKTEFGGLVDRIDTSAINEGTEERGEQLVAEKIMEMDLGVSCVHCIDGYVAIGGFSGEVIYFFPLHFFFSLSFHHFLLFFLQIIEKKN